MGEGVEAGGARGVAGASAFRSCVELIRAVCAIMILPLRALCTEPRLVFTSLCSMRRRRSLKRWEMRNYVDRDNHCWLTVTRRERLRLSADC